MAREYAAILCSIWGDPEWRRLRGDAQHLYLTLLTQGSLTFCGVTSYQPKRLAVLNEDYTTESVEAAADMLEARGYVVIDRDTDEVLIRSFVRHDGLLKRPNVAVAMAKSYQGIVSLKVRRAFIRELRRLRDDERFAELTAWRTPKVADLFGEPFEEPIPEPLPEPIVEPIAGNGSGSGSANPSGNQCLTTSTASASSTATTPSNTQASAIADPPPTRPEVEDICAHLADLIEANGSKRPNITGRWRDSARLLIDTDGRTPEEIHRAINYSQRDEFWRTVILSMPKLREKYDQLRLSAQRVPAISNGAHMSTTDQRVAVGMSLTRHFEALEEGPS